MSAIKSVGKLVFHVVGDTGNLQGGTPEQQAVADAMEADPASFLYHLGDVVYFWGQPEGYYPQLYEPYLHYPGPIFAIPGNHDGDPRPSDPPSLTGFTRNFCSAQAKVTPDAQDAPRVAMTQPNVYWTLLTPYATIIGLYSNVPAGGQFEQKQLDWLNNELRTAPTDKALILTVHHPVYSLDRFHTGSTNLEETLDAAYASSKRRPDLILTGHIHNFQRYTETANGGQIPHIIAGAGGYQHLHGMQTQPNGNPIGVPYKLQDADNVTLENYNDKEHGYLHLEATPTLITGQYYTVNPTTRSPQLIDSFELDYKAHTLNKNTRIP